MENNENKMQQLIFTLWLIAGLVLGTSCKNESKKSRTGARDEAPVGRTFAHARDGMKTLDRSQGQRTMGGNSGTRGEEEDDHASAYDYATSLDGAESRQAIFKHLMSAIAKHPEYVAEKLTQAEISSTDKASIAALLMTSWPDAEAALEWADKNIHGSDRGRMIGKGLARLMVESPVAALNFLESMEPSAARKEATTIMYSSWAGTHPVEALQISDQIQDTDERKFMKEVAYYGLAFQQPQKAIEVFDMQLQSGMTARSQESISDLTVLSGAIAGARLLKEAPDAVFSWALSLPSDISEGARKTALLGWSQRDAMSAAASLSQLEATDRAQLAVMLIDDWSVRDPAEAAAWLATYTDAPERTQMTATMVKKWAHADPIAAYSWLGQLPAGESRDAGILQLIRREGPADPNTVTLRTNHGKSGELDFA